MSDHPKQTGGALDLALFAKTYFEGGRLKLIAVLVLQAVLTSITGIGLLLILPLLGLLGFGPGGTDNPLLAKLSAVLDELGLELTLESGLALFVGAICLRAIASISVVIMPGASAAADINCASSTTLKISAIFAGHLPMLKVRVMSE